MKRASGVLLHMTSLWGEYGTGGMGKAAEEFVDFLSDSGFSYWQMLPVCIPDGSNSPYKSPSAFACNPYLIDLEELRDLGLITEAELEDARQLSPYACEFERLNAERYPLLFKAAARTDEDTRKQVEEFITSHKDVDAACIFLTGEENEERLYAHRFIQYTFFRQWKKFHDYANSKGIRLIGDIPIYVAPDSCDVEADPDQFLLDKENKPSCVAGVPPDYFSPKGQLWGNPLYDWKAMKKDGFSWWRRRMRLMFELFDGVRIDHFRAIESYWCLPADATDATVGKWVKGPGMDFVKMLKEESGDRLIIAEDLGDITPQVEALVKKSGFPGMRVFQFGFPDSPSCPHKVHNYIENCVAYTGTHDNNTLLGYLWELDDRVREQVYDYIGSEKDIDACHGGIIRAVMASRADISIFPLQDLLRYGADTRMNIPGVASGNWSYRVTKEQLDTVDREKLRHMNLIYGRC